MKAEPVPEKVQDAMESLIRAATDEKYVLLGIVFKQGSIALFRNTSDSPGSLFRRIADLIDQKVEDGLISEHRITPLN